MAVLNKEIKKGAKGFLIWTAVIAFMLSVCVFVYPAMKDQMGEMNEMFANMGSFTAAFGMDQLNFGTFIGFYGIEIGNVLGLGGGFFAAYLGITMLSKEEKEHTAEFLLTHPISRVSVLIQKLAAVMIQIVLMNVITFLFGVISAVIVGEDVPFKELFLIHSVYLILQIEIGAVCFGLSAFVRRGSIGIGLGSAAVLYFMNLIVNISVKAEPLKYITPYAYAKPEDVIQNMSFDWLLVGLGILYGIVFVAVGFIIYGRKDMTA